MKMIHDVVGPYRTQNLVIEPELVDAY